MHAPQKPRPRGEYAPPHFTAIFPAAADPATAFIGTRAQCLGVFPGTTESDLDRGGLVLCDLSTIVGRFVDPASEAARRRYRQHTGATSATADDVRAWLLDAAWLSPVAAPALGEVAYQHARLTAAKRDNVIAAAAEMAAKDRAAAMSTLAT